MTNAPEPHPASCLNCGTPVTDKFCPHCGQKTQPTRLPLRMFLGEAIATFLNLDGLWWRTLRDLFRHPGKLTRDYNDGKRAAYVPPLRLYLSISVIYFFTVSLIGQNRVMFISFGVDDGNTGAVFGLVQYLMFFLVPAFAAILHLLHRKRNGFYVEYLVMAVHLHSVWFVLFWLRLIIDWLIGPAPIEPGSIRQIIDGAASFISEVLPLVYVVASLRGMVGASWVMTIIKGFAAMFLHLLIMGGTVALYMFLRGITSVQVTAG
ncbi:DUF3667 domain-containing protein [Synoicihabitans lomoniglobus]|uniref:DUF3667 domain-containing protein n=1 Tax=Synoicihabitans lomoniglobus TaxID=2909285 RepID=A0AAE9ZVR2_9BACT|nr:DUF3667 domain-containing protein [Opitutaceae bacterium LMO-M01]WED65071.1 DUF3667 domain-containing protein [Opitutaceae bacterium LMO-M01]